MSTPASVGFGILLVALAKASETYIILALEEVVSPVGQLQAEHMWSLDIVSSHIGRGPRKVNRLLVAEVVCGILLLQEEKTTTGPARSIQKHDSTAHCM